MIKFNEIRIKTELQTGLKKFKRLEEIMNDINKGDLSRNTLESLQFNFVHYMEFVIKISEHICLKNGRYESNMTNQNKIESCVELKFIDKKYENDLNYLVGLRNRIVHEYHIPRDEEVMKAASEKINVIKYFYILTTELVTTKKLDKF